MINSLFKIWIFAFLILININGAQGQTIEEYTLKAIWLTKFPYFIRWPDGKTDTSKYFVIGVYKSNPFEGKLDPYYKELKVNNQEVRIKLLKNQNDIHDISMLFIPNENDLDLSLIMKKCNEHGILIISEKKGNAEKGAHINFITKKQKIRFEINETSMKNSGFFVSYRLLNIADVVKTIE